MTIPLSNDALDEIAAALEAEAEAEAIEAETGAA